MKRINTVGPAEGLRAYRGDTDARLVARLMHENLKENGQQRPLSILYKGIKAKANPRNTWLLGDYGYIRIFPGGKFGYLRFDLSKKHRTEKNIEFIDRKLHQLCGRSNKGIRLMLFGGRGWKHRLARREGFSPIRYFYEMESAKHVNDWGADKLERTGFHIEGFSGKTDIDEFTRCYNEVFRDSFEHTPVKRNDWSRAAENGELTKDTLLLLRGNNRTMEGFILLSHYLHRNRGKRYGFIEDLGVRKQHRGKGLGGLLLKYGIKRLQEKYRARAVRLHLDSQNESGALGLYRRIGFDTVGMSVEYQHSG